MKLIWMLLVGVSIQSMCSAEVIVQRNGADGNFIWNPEPNQCWPRVQTWLDISQPLSQSGARSSRTLEWHRGCVLSNGCWEYARSILFADGFDVQIAGGNTFTYQASLCYTVEYTVSTPGSLSYGATIDQTLRWQAGPLTTELVSPGGGGFRLAWIFVPTRVRLADGWHYGWVMLSDSPGIPTTGTVYEEFRPGAYAFETLPNMAVKTPPCRADLNFDGVVDIEDYLTFIEYFARGDSRARFSGYTYSDNTIDFFDYLDFLSDFVTCGP